MKTPKAVIIAHAKNRKPRAAVATDPQRQGQERSAASPVLHRDSSSTPPSTTPKNASHIAAVRVELVSRPGSRRFGSSVMAASPPWCSTITSAASGYICRSVMRRSRITDVVVTPGDVPVDHAGLGAARTVGMLAGCSDPNPVARPPKLSTSLVKSAARLGGSL